MSNDIYLRKSRLYTWFLMMISIVSNLSYYPFFQQSNYARNIVIGLWCVLLFIAVFHKTIYVRENPLIILCYLNYFVFVINSLIGFLCGNHEIFSNHFFRTVTISIIILSIGYLMSFDFSHESMKKILMVYMYSIIIFSIPLFTIYLVNGDVSTSQYSYKFGKNEISVLLLCALIIMLICFTPKSLLSKIVFLIGLFFILIDLVLLRCRSVYFGVIITFVFVLFKRNAISKWVKIIVVLLLTLFILFFILNRDALNFFINKILFAGRDGDSIDSISSGRVTIIKDAMKVFRQNFLFGVGSYETVDCIYVSILTNYGIMGYPLIVLTFIPLIYNISQMKNGKSSFLCLGLISLSLFFVGLFEELAPFGPGTRCYILWLMTGISFGLDNDEKKRLIEHEDS